MYCALLRGSSRLLANNTARLQCWQPVAHPAIWPAMHPVYRASALRHCSSPSGPCSGSKAGTGSGCGPGPGPGSCSGAKPGLQPVSIAERTINLAHQTSYTGAKRPAQMVSKSGTVCPRNTSIKGTPRHIPVSKPITSCKSKDMAKKCPQPLPPCPPKKQMSLMQMVGKAIVFVLKACIVAGLVYWTIDIGVWGDADESAVLYQQLDTKVRELLRMKTPGEGVQELPKTDHIYHNALVTWNKGVVYMFDAIAYGIDRIAKALCLDPEKKD